MNDLVKKVDELPLIVKLILAIPFLDIFWNVMRVIRSVAKSSVLGIVLGVVLIIVGIPFMWLIDIICILVKGNIWWLD